MALPCTNIDCVQNETMPGPLGVAFVLLITKIYYEKSILASPDNYPKDYAPQLLLDTSVMFDIIIVGGGTAGAVLANRLSEVEQWNILLIEAGKLPTASSEVPAFYYATRGSDEDWSFQTQQEKQACQGVKDNRCLLSRGKVMGGTSSINDLHYLRGLPLDFFHWPADSKFGWNTDSIMENYKKHEHCVEKCDNNGELGTEGELGLTTINDGNEFKDLLYRAANQTGYNRVKVGIYPGFFDVHGTIRQGSRENIAKAFLRPVRGRDNLAVIREGLVTKILTDIPTDRRISGVAVQIGHENVTIRAKKEVILTAGAINTAQLLMLSGFGPTEHLKKLNIPTVVDVDVGKNMQDQVSTMLFVGIDKGAPVSQSDCDGCEELMPYLLHRAGDLTTTNINDVVGLINTKQADLSNPNILIYHYYFERQDPTLKPFLKSYGFVDNIVKSILNSNLEQRLILFMPTLIKPKSKGYVELQSDDPFKPPNIFGRYLSEKEDFETLLSGAQYVLSLIETDAFAERGAKFLEVDMPNCRNYKYCNEGYLSCAVRNMAVPRSEVIGTAVMGDIHECCRATDERLLLDGIRHLRIVDGSVMPEHVTGNLEATVAMMAENAADEIKRCWLSI